MTISLCRASLKGKPQKSTLRKKESYSEDNHHIRRAWSTHCSVSNGGRATLQVAISLAVSIYFIHERLKSRIRAFLYGVGSFLTSWLLGTFLMVSVMPPLLQGPRSLEVSTSLISYILLWISSTYLK
uniref:Uncharacterized protein n=1 Tax=Ananas comosus var. bracteatus TaxID=296719 RepID=A0A6V7Q588_ANACO|nr:unnamed protein product [Ananas comosus var. bracteatus]